MCLLPLIAGICLADPSRIELYADASRQTSGDFQYSTRSAGPIPDATIGRIGISLETPLWFGLASRVGWEHTSIINTNSDRGQERFFMGFVWRPFR